MYFFDFHINIVSNTTLLIITFYGLCCCEYYNFNAYKGQPGRMDLGVAKRQLANNPLAHSIS